MRSPLSPILSPGQLQLLAARGEEHTAAAGEFLFQIGDARYPFIVVLEGEAAIFDGAGNEIARQGPGGFLGEMNLLTGQTVFVDGLVTQPMRYIAVERDDLRPLLFEDGALADVLLNTFIRRRELLQEHEGVGFEVIGPRSSAPTRRLLEYARRGRLPHVWRDTEGDDDPVAAAIIADLQPDELPLVRLPGGAELRNPSNGQLWRALGIGLELGPAGGGRPGGDRGRPGGSRRGRLRGLRGAQDARRREHRARRPGRGLTPDRELPRLSSGDQRHGAGQPRDHPGAQVRGPDGDALPGSRAGARQRHPSDQARGGARDHRPRRRPRDGRGLPAAAPPGPRPVRGPDRLLRRRAARGARLRWHADRGRRRRQLRRPGGGVARARAERS